MKMLFKLLSVNFFIYLLNTFDYSETRALTGGLRPKRFPEVSLFFNLNSDYQL